jgi:hypothetical protein
MWNDECIWMIVEHNVDGNLFKGILLYKTMALKWHLT